MYYKIMREITESENTFPKITLTPKSRVSFYGTDMSSVFFRFSTGSGRESEGLVSYDGTRLYDFCLLSGKKFLTRFGNTRTVLECGSCDLIFNSGDFVLKFGLIKDVLCFKIKSGKKGFKKGISLILLATLDLAGIIDSGSGVVSNNSFTIEKPSLNLIKKLLSVYGEKAAYARVLSFTGGFDRDIDIYIGLNSGVSGSQDLFNLLESKAFEKNIEKLKGFQNLSFVKTGVPAFDKAVSWAKYSGFQFLAEKPSCGIWAGLPWFRDNWGRDTFIALPGILLVTGLFDEARSVIRGFAEFQNKDKNSSSYGRIPNRYGSDGNIIYNNADGTLWFVREVLDYCMYTGDMDFLKEMWPVIVTGINADIDLRTDDFGFLVHGDADTWMDARLNGENAWSPRGNRANDIQVLWYTALESALYISKLLGEGKYIQKWEDISCKLKDNFLKIYWDGDSMADCILSDGTPDKRIRPNQMFLSTVPFCFFEDFIPRDIEEKIVRNLISRLTFPYGICSLSQDDYFFHPYHTGCDKYQKDAAYHNGTIWGWNTCHFLTLLLRTGYLKNAWELALNLAEQILTLGCTGTMSENLNAFSDKKGNLVPSGTWAQAWSVSEFTRVCFQDFLGIRPNFLEKTVYFSPRIPEKLSSGSATIPVPGGSIFMEWGDSKKTDYGFSREFKILLDSSAFPELLFKVSTSGALIDVLVKSNEEVFVEVASPVSKFLDFAVPGNKIASYKWPKSVTQKDFLEEIISQERFNGDHEASHTSVHQ